MGVGGGSARAMGPKPKRRGLVRRTVRWDGGVKVLAGALVLVSLVGFEA